MGIGDDVIDKEWTLYKLNDDGGYRLLNIDVCFDCKTGSMHYYKIDDGVVRTDFKTLISLRDFLIDLNLDKMTNSKDCTY